MQSTGYHTVSMSNDSKTGPPETDSILDALDLAVLTVDPEMNVLTFNRAAERITGLSRDQVIGRPCRRLMDCDLGQEDCPLEQALRTGEEATRSGRLIKSTDGTETTVNIRAGLIRDDRGRIIGGVESFHDATTEATLRRDLNRRYTVRDMVGRSEAMQNLFRLLPEAARSQAAILIQGQGGVGKETLARAIHDLALGPDQPFVVVHCQSTPEAILERELFGSSAADPDLGERPGRLAAARGGTVFLDEIGSLGPAIQVKLVRLLDEQAFTPLGSDRPRRADVRLVAATTLDLQEEVRCGRFRADLFLRLSSTSLEAPSLAQRREDIPYLIDHFLAKLRARTGRNISGLTESALAALLNHDYPGNIRQLQNFLEHGFALCQEGRLDLDHLPAELRRRADPLSEEDADLSLISQSEKKLIIEALHRHNGRRSPAARELGLSTTTLWRRMKQFGLM